MLGVVLAFATVTIVTTNNLRVAGAVDKMACAMKYGNKALLIVTDEFELSGKTYDLSAKVDRPSLHPLCLVPISLYNNADSKGEYTDGQGNVYIALDLAAVDREYSAMRNVTQAVNP